MGAADGRETMAPTSNEGRVPDPKPDDDRRDPRTKTRMRTLDRACHRRPRSSRS